MDKYEYKLRLEEIKSLNRKGRFQEAAQVADGIDWKKVRNVSTLGIISDVYKVNRRFEDAKAILLLANEQSPQNRRILYSLCDLTIKMGQVVEALEYYKEFVQLSPNDNNKYILLYKIYEAQDISLDERIAVLKEYKKREYNEKWAYELAFLYHRVGLATECVEECDQLILWFGEGKYVAKAMELKMRYVPLSPAQQQAYERIFGRRPVEQQEQPSAAEEAEEYEETAAGPETAEDAPEEVPVDGELDIQVKTMDMGKYNTMNLQAALAESMREVLEPVDDMTREYGGDNAEYLEDITRIQEASAVWDAQATGQLEEEQEADGQQDMARSGDPAEENGMGAILGQEYDGQISMALQEGRVAEKQITGQMSIEDVLAEWEALKKLNEEKRRQETRQRMLRQTGSIFEDFEQNSRDGVLERLQREESLPIEEVQRRHGREEFSPVRADHMGRTEINGVSPVGFAPGQPVPVNGAVQGAMGAAVAGVQGMPADKGMVEGTPMEEITVGGMPVTDKPASADAGVQLSEAERKRLSIEALMREAEEKQREARELLMQLERERQLAAQNAAGTPQPVQTAQNMAEPPQPVPSAHGMPEMLQDAQSAPEPLRNEQYGNGMPEQPQEAQYVQGTPEQPQGAQYVQGVPEQFQGAQYVQGAPGQLWNAQYVQGVPEQPQGAQYVQGAPEQLQGAQYVQGTPEQPRGAQYVQGTPEQPQSVQYVQGVPEQPQGAQYVQGMPEQPQGTQYVQGTPEQPQSVQYVQGVPEQPQGAQHVQGTPEQPQGAQYVQGMPGQLQGAQYVQGVPGQLQGAQYMQGMPERPQGVQYVQGMPERPQGIQYGQGMPKQPQYIQNAPGQPVQNGQPPQTMQYIQNPSEQAVPEQEPQSAQDIAEPQPGQDIGSTQELIRDKQLEEHERSMTQDEKDLFSPFVPTKGAMRQLIKALDSLSLSAYTGNMIITGAPGSDMIKLAKSVVKIMRVRDGNFSGQIAKISGDVLNSRNAGDVVSKIQNGALIIEKGSKLSNKGATDLANALNQEQTGIIVFLLDSKRAIAGLMERNPLLASCFTARFDIEAMDTAMLVKYGCQYAYNMEYAIDEMGRLALHTRIEDMQTKNHAVTVEEVREIIEEAIAHAERFSVTHFTDILFRRRYDDDDMVILKERDFI